MCKCRDIDFGSYDAQTYIKDLSPYPQMVEYRGDRAQYGLCLDECVAEEVLELWKLGITTTGCCCGHNKISGYIGVIDADIPRMKELGYLVAPNQSRPGDEDSFYPKQCSYLHKPY